MKDFTLVFVDAGFLSELSKHFGNGKRLSFDYIKFLENLSSKKDLIIKKIFYYTAPPYQSDKPSPDEILRKKGYDNFIKNFSKNKLVQIREGRVQKLINSDKEIEFHQKGVDTLMTLDLALIDNHFPDVKKIILITSDSDFCPVIKEIKKLGIKVILFTYLEKKRNSRFFISHHLIDCCDEVEYLKKEDLTEFSFKK